MGLTHRMHIPLNGSYDVAAQIWYRLERGDASVVEAVYGIHRAPLVLWLFNWPSPQLGSGRLSIGTYLYAYRRAGLWKTAAKP